jgi:GTP-dependent phosphoenolpyruvate carboxykinase
MPRYFFNVIDGCSIIDNQGSELASLKEARVEAIQLASAILRDEGDTFWNGQEWHMNVTDASGQSVLKLHFSAEDQGTTSEGDKIRVPA